jgi:1,4-dihydroxy-2-naphthoate octaprenyltransferase
MSELNSNNLSQMRIWLLAARPKTLPAAVAPVIVGSALAYAHKNFALLPAICALAVALLLQIGVNLANDYFDYIKGIDSEDRLGPLRITQSGLRSPAQVKTAMNIIFALTLVPGFYLLKIGGWPVVLLGSASILAALAYSGGPYPLASHGLGDLFVFFFFGLVAVCGTYYVQALQLSPMVVLMGIILGLLITAILVVNNLRDIETDRKSGKRTLAVMIGQDKTRSEYMLLLLGAYTIPVIIWLSSFASAWLLLPLATLPLAFLQIRRIRKTSDGPALNDLLAKTARLSFFFSILLAGGLILSWQ